MKATATTPPNTMISPPKLNSKSRPAGSGCHGTQHRPRSKTRSDHGRAAEGPMRSEHGVAQLGALLRDAMGSGRRPFGNRQALCQPGKSGRPQVRRVVAWSPRMVGPAAMTAGQITPGASRYPAGTFAGPEHAAGAPAGTAGKSVMHSRLAAPHFAISEACTWPCLIDRPIATPISASARGIRRREMPDTWPR